MRSIWRDEPDRYGWICSGRLLFVRSRGVLPWIGIGARRQYGWC
jgi:hypothetical protein